LTSNNGDLTLKKSAIEGFVGEKVKENDYLKNSKIAVSLFKNKIKIDIKGEIIPRVEVAQKAQVLEQEIIEGFGLEHTVKLKVKVNTLSKDDNPKRQRVM
ncbi:alkaline shock response membrane anchor protein AmaP, partial [Lactococcus lactis]|uniref:alkaline shock response membrane anchor protein AmaP n=1 Tax=Lactococcus lactis TaxID=1358 RepID=UPI0022E778BF